MQYSSRFDKPFVKRLKKLKKDSPELFKRLMKKISEIVENPEHYKPLTKVLKGKRRAHVGSFVIIFMLDEKNGEVIFLEFDHHDKVYRLGLVPKK